MIILLSFVKIEENTKEIKAMKDKIQHFNLQNCNFHEYKNELFIYNEDKEMTPLSLINKFIAEREKNKEGTLFIFNDLFKTLESEAINNIKNIINSDLINYKRVSRASVLKTQKNISTFLSILISQDEKKGEKPVKTYENFYDLYKETLLFHCFERYLNDREDLFIKYLIKSPLNLLTEYHLDFMFLHASKKGMQLSAFAKFLNDYFINDDMHILNLCKKECSAKRIISEMDSESLRQHLINKKVNLNSELSTIIQNQYHEKNVIIIMDSMLRYNTDLTASEISYVNEFKIKQEKESLEKIIINGEEKQIKKRL